jgi:amino acid adenylation domain-containing protein
VLSREKEPAPVGVSGELYIGGAGVSRGYLGRPDLTAERFVPDPFSRRGGEMLYRTGDQCRYQPDGRIEYQGRIDHQVKIRGYRIEPGEIEAVMTQHAGVREAVVVAASEEGKGPRLVAYYVGEQEQAVGVEEMREYLGRRLPEYMVPAVYVRLERLPMTPNGKIDRSRLPEVGEGRPELEQKYVAARSGSEEVLAGIWSQVLGLERVGIEDSFFALGGDSIRSVAVVSKAQEAGLRISLAEIFEQKTIRKIVEQMGRGEGRAERERSELMSLVSESDRRKIAEQNEMMKREGKQIEDAYPMTMMQAGMIYHSQYRAGTAIYHSIIKVELSGRLDVEAMREAIDRLMKRHASLRTTFELTSYSEPLQMVWREVEVPLEVEDIRGLSEQEQERRVEEWLEEEKGRGFDLRQGPLVRFKVMVRGEERFEFGFSAHHAIIDGWSDGVVFGELQSDYEALMRGEEMPKREELRTSVREYVAEEKEEVKSEESREYWREKLRERVVTKLPKKEAEQGEESRREEFGVARVEISEEVSKRLQKVAKEAAVPIKSVLLAAHLKVMSVIGGQEEVMTGVVTSGRLEERDGEKVVGLFVNTVPYGKKMRGGKWVELVREVFEEEKEMMKYRRYPLAEIQRMGGGGELFETCFNYVHLHGNGEVRGEGEMEVKGARYVTETNLAMMAHFSMDPYEMKLGLELDYDRRQVSRKQAERIGGYYERTLAEIAREEEGRYEEHWPMSEEEREEIVERWNETEEEREGEARSIEEMIEREAEERPDRIAVVGEGEEISYGELNRRANQLGNYLRRKGVRAEEVVGVMVERGVEMVVAMLGVMKAGGAYVPMDVEYPRQRLEHMVEDSKARIVIVEGKRERERVEGWGGVEVVDMEEEREEIERQSERRERVEVEGENLAYVIYTSGSTGLPKGVAIERRSTVELIRWAADTFTEEELSGVLASTSICFDLSVFEIFVPLCCGGKVILARNALDLTVEGKREGVTLINTVPSAMAELVRARAIPATVKTINLAGEALPKALVDAIHDNDRVERVYNLYGPTEDTTYSTFALMNRNSGQIDSTVSIGRPVTNSQVYILNERLQPVPVGVAGSLFIGGDGLARGYLNRPEMTAERFTPNPFAAQPGGRMYTTGDLARYDEKGEIEFLGRKDHQVKIRGFRIEMGEIESILNEHSSVRAVTVLAREDVPGEIYLAAYIVPDTLDLPSAAELRAFLKERVPDHMVPSAMIFLEEFPLTPNGKVDRRALPVPDKTRTDQMAQYEAPRTAMEEVIAEIWAELLRVERVGVHDNFFELGGHSLMVTQVLSRVRAIFDVELPLSELVESPTVAGLAEAIEAALRSEEGLGASPF